MKTVITIIKNNHFTMHPSGAMYWKEQDALLIADVHLGKVSHFRKHGSAVPKATIANNFNKLDEVLLFFKPKVLYFLGDLFHSHLNIEWQYFKEWVSSSNTLIKLIVGNHDIISESLFMDIEIEVIEQKVIDGFILTHHPLEENIQFNFCGHIHPSTSINGLGKQRLKLPCFFKRTSQLILPAFGDFTGTFELNSKDADEVFVIAEDEVVYLN